MSLGMTTAPAAHGSIGGAFLPEIVSLAKRSLLWAVLYGVFSQASRGGCPGDGPDLDAACYSATLGPSPLVWLAMAVVFVVSVSRVSRAVDVADVTRILRRAAWAMPVIAVAGLVIGVWSFVTLPESAFFGTSLPPGVVVTFH